MNAALFEANERITVDGAQYVVLSIPVAGAAMVVREIDLLSGASTLTPFLIEMPTQEPAV